jgi:hypothetical protein
MIKSALEQQYNFQFNKMDDLIESEHLLKWNEIYSVNL